MKKYMFNRTCCGLLSLGVLITVVSLGWGQAQASPPTESGSENSSTQARNLENGFETSSSNSPNRPGHVQRRRPAKRLIAELKRLQRAMQAKLRFKPSQSERIDHLFHDYYSRLNRREKEVLAQEQSGEGVGAGRGRFQQMSKAFRQANDSGDDEKLDELRQQFRSLMDARQQDNNSRSPESFLRNLSEVLNVNQRSSFDKMLKKFNLTSSRATVHPRLRGLHRAISNPMFRFATTRRRELVLIVLAGSDEISRMDHHGEALEDTLHEIRKRLDQRLSLKERRKLEALVRVYDQRGRYRKNFRSQQLIRRGNLRNRSDRFPTNHSERNRSPRPHRP